MDTISCEVLTQNFLELGVKPGGVLLVHTSFSKIKPIEVGPLGLISALRSALGPDGTLVMPSMSCDDDHPFDKTKSPCPEIRLMSSRDIVNVVTSHLERDETIFLHPQELMKNVTMPGQA